MAGTTGGRPGSSKGQSNYRPPKKKAPPKRPTTSPFPGQSRQAERAVPGKSGRENEPGGSAYAPPKRPKKSPFPGTSKRARKAVPKRVKSEQQNRRLNRRLKRKRRVERAVERVERDIRRGALAQARKRIAEDAETGLRFTDDAAGRKARREAPKIDTKSPVAKSIAPALKALEVTTRPSKVVGNIIKGERVDRALTKGAKGEGPLPGQALGLKGVPAFVVDVASDPTTYLSAGAAIPAKAAAKKAGQKTYKTAAKQAPVVPPASKGVVKKAEKKAARKAVKRGARPDEVKQAAAKARERVQQTTAQRRIHVRAQRKANRAARRAAEGQPQNKGLTLGVGRVRTTGKTTARVMRRLRRKDSAVAREVGTTFSPHVRPAGVKHREFRKLKAAEREARTQTTRGRFRAVHTARRLKDSIPDKDYAKVIDAIERGTVYNLRKELRGPAREIEKAFKSARKAERKAGIDTAQVSNTGYFSHQLRDVLEEGTKKAKRDVRGRKVKPGYTKTRQFRGTVRKIEEEGGPEFSKNIPLVVADRLAKSAADTSQARLNQAVLKAGRTVKHGNGISLEKGEAVAVIKGSDLSFADKKLEQAIADGTAPKDAKYVVVNRDFVESLRKRVAPGGNRPGVLKAYDKAQGGFKFTATYINPGFHFRNLYGDTQNAYLAQPVGSLAANVGRSARTLRRVGKQEEALLTGKRLGKAGTVTVRGRHGRKTKVTLDQLAKEAERHGAIRQGFLGRELPELLRESESTVKRIGRRKSTAPSLKTGRAGKRLVQNREDLIRLATYIGGRKRGLSPRDATSRTMQYHFDYGDLSQFERDVARRFFPFYTFTARNIPLQAKTLLTHPGKYANFEKARQETMLAMGLEEDEFNSRLKEYQQRGVPFPLVLDGKVLAVSTAFPLQDLNQLPVNLDPGDFADEQMKKTLSMLTPLLRTPVELYQNYSNFFRGQIERDDSPLVAAPKFVGDFPGSVKKKLGVVRGLDRRSGKKVWMWPGKVDYIAKVVPGPSNFGFQILTDAENRRGQGAGQKLLSYAGGIKADTIDKQSARIERLFDEKERLEKEQAKLRQQGIGSEQGGRKETPEWRQRQDRINRIYDRIGTLSTKRGDKVPLLKPPGRKESSGSGWDQFREGGAPKQKSGWDAFR